MVADTHARVAGLHVECLTSRSELVRIRQEWDALWSTQPDRTPFQSSAWLIPWCDAFGAGSLRVLAVRDGTRLTGLVPLFLTDTGEARELRLLGAGVSDYLDLIAAPGLEDAVAGVLAQYLVERRDDWSLCALDRLPAGSPLLRMPAPGGAHETCVPDAPSPVLALPASPDGIATAIGSRMAGNIRTCRRRAERLGAVQVECADARSVGELLSALFDLHAARWASKGGEGVLADDAVRAFHRAAAPALLEAGMLRLLALRIGGRTAAVHYGLHAAGRTYYYIGGFDPAFASVSAGTLVIAAALEQAVAEHAHAFDFLGGHETYKYQWRAIDRARLARHFHHEPARAPGDDRRPDRDPAMPAS